MRSSQYMDDPVLRHEAKFQGMARGGIASADGSYQELGGRITRYPRRRIEKVPPTPHRDITLMRRWMDAMGVDIACMFPTPMLNLAACPRVEVEVALAQAYNRWLCERILGEESRASSRCSTCRSTIPRPATRPCRSSATSQGVIGFMVTATHYRGVHDNAYAKTYAALQERGLPLAFHAAFNWADPGLLDDQPLHRRACARLLLAQHAAHDQLDRERHAGAFPAAQDDLDRSGLAWVPFLMQRLDNEYMMRTSDCAAAQAEAERLHARHVLHLAADGDGRQPQGARADLRDDQCGDAVALFVRLSALGHGPAEHDLRPAVPERRAPSATSSAAMRMRLFNLEPVLSETKLARKAAGAAHSSPRSGRSSTSRVRRRRNRSARWHFTQVPRASMIVARRTGLRDAPEFDRGLEHHAVGKLLDHAALDFLPWRLAWRIAIAAAAAAAPRAAARVRPRRPECRRCRC